MRNMLEDKGFRQILCEGGPSLLGSMLAAGVVDELDLTWSPMIVGGDAPRHRPRARPEPPASPEAPARGGRHHPRALVRQPLTAKLRDEARRPSAPSGPGSTFHSLVCRAASHGSIVTRSGRAAGQRQGRAHGDELVVDRVDQQDRGARARRRAATQLVLATSTGSCTPDQPACRAAPHQGAAQPTDRRRDAVGAGVVGDHVAPVDDRRVEDHVGDVVGQPGPAQGLQDDGATHRPADEEQLAGAALHRVQAGVLDVAPLREAQVVAAVGPTAGTDVVAVAGDR